MSEMTEQEKFQLRGELRRLAEKQQGARRMSTPSGKESGRETKQEREAREKSERLAALGEAAKGGGSPFSGKDIILENLTQTNPDAVVEMLKTIHPALSGGSGGRVGASQKRIQFNETVKQALEAAAIGRQAQAQRNAKGQVSGGGASGSIRSAGSSQGLAQRKMQQALARDRAEFEQQLAMETLERQAELQRRATELEANLRARDQARRESFVRSLIGGATRGGNLSSTNQQIVNVAGLPITRTLKSTRQISPTEILGSLSGLV